jgi:hypothetical protein
MRIKHLLCGTTLSILLIVSLYNIAAAQNEIQLENKTILKLTGYIDIFYVYDFNEPKESSRLPFLYNHNRHNEFNLNLGLIKLSAENNNYRANFALQTGTYANDNYSLEPGLLKNIFEANVGLSLNSDNNLWIDAGIIPSHIGFESAISFDNLTMTRSLLAENSPYFLTGAKLTYKPNNKLEIAALILNGWQRIQRLQGNSMPSAGTQLKYNPNDNIAINWSTFIGTDDPDSSRRMRYFNNIYGQFRLSENILIIAGIDFGFQQKSKGNEEYNVWYSPVIIGQYAISERWKTAIRFEYYNDETGIIIPVDDINGFKTAGYSWNIDYQPESNVMCRFEGRWLKSNSKIFQDLNQMTVNNFFIGTSLSIKFNNN